MSCLTVTVRRVETCPGASAQRVETGMAVAVTLQSRMKAVAGLVCATGMGLPYVITSNRLRIITKNNKYIVTKRRTV